jgi:predicted amidohydrolase
MSARAIENQVYIAVTSTVGNLRFVPYMAIDYGQAAILIPSDYFFARDGIAAEGIINQERSSSQKLSSIYWTNCVSTEV